MNKKIIFSNFDDIKNPFYSGGGAYATHEVAKGLANRSFDVTVVTGKYPGSRDEIVDGVKYKRIGLANINPQLAQLVFQFSLSYYVLTLTYDIWFESFTPPFSTGFLPIFTKKPVVGVTHLLAGKEMSKKYHLPFYIIEKFGLKFYKTVIVLNESIEKQIHLANEKIKTLIIPNGVSSKLIELEYDKNGENILFLGRIDINQKGLDLLIPAFNKIKDRTTLDIIIAGDGQKSDIAELKKLIHENGLGNRIHFIGKVLGEKKDEVFKKAKFFIMPSRYEAFPLTLLEAFSYKCPVIYFNIDTLKFLPEEVGIKINPFDIDGFIEGVVKLDQNPQLLNEKSIAAKKYVENFSWEKTIEKYASLITNLEY